MSSALLFFKFYPLNYEKFIEQQIKLSEIQEERLTKLNSLQKVKKVFFFYF